MDATALPLLRCGSCSLSVMQDEVIRKYGLSSVTLEKFFVGPLPEFLSPASVVRTAKHPVVNGCFLSSHLPSAQNGLPRVNADVIIDLTDDDPEVPEITAVVSADHADTSKMSVQKNHDTEALTANVLPKKRAKTSKRRSEKNQRVQVPADAFVSKKHVKASKSSVQRHNVEVQTVAADRKKHAASSKSLGHKRDLSAQKHDPAGTVVPKKRAKTSKSLVENYSFEDPMLKTVSAKRAVTTQDLEAAIGTGVSEMHDETSHSWVQNDDFEIPTVTVFPERHVISAKRRIQKSQRVKPGWLTVHCLYSLPHALNCVKFCFWCRL